MKNKIYLAGPMDDLSVEGMTSWRNHASKLLYTADLVTLDPCRRVSFHDQMYAGQHLQDTVKNMNLCKRIFKQDLQDIAESKVVLADVRRDSGRGTGTSMELMFAHMKNKIIILWANEGDSIHPFYEAMYSEKHYNLDDAIYACMEYY